MKKFSLLLMLLFTLLSCSQEEVSNTLENGKKYIVSLGFSGEITDIIEVPLRSSTDNNLYGLQIYSSPVSTDEYKPYAYGLFDRKENMTIELVQGNKYKFISTMVVDGKEKIHSAENKYWAPFNWGHTATPIGNEFIYSSSSINSWISLGYATLSNTTSGDAYKRPNIERYYGEYHDYIPSEDGSISISMNKVIFGVKVIAENFTEGTLVISLEDAPNMNLKYPSTEIQDIFTFSNTEYTEIPWTSDDYTEKIPVTITWKKAEDISEPVASQQIVFKRNKQTIIKVKLKEYSNTNSVSITEENDAMLPGDSIIIQ